MDPKPKPKPPKPPKPPKQPTVAAGRARVALATTLVGAVVEAVRRDLVAGRRPDIDAFGVPLEGLRTADSNLVYQALRKLARDGTIPTAPKLVGRIHAWGVNVSATDVEHILAAGREQVAEIPALVERLRAATPDLVASGGCIVEVTNTDPKKPVQRAGRFFPNDPKLTTRVAIERYEEWAQINACAALRVRVVEGTPPPRPPLPPHREPVKLEPHQITKLREILA